MNKLVAVLDSSAILAYIKGEPGSNSIDKILDYSIMSIINLTETIIYYKSPVTGIRFLDRLRSRKMLAKLYKDAVSKYLNLNPGTELVHLHVANKAGSVALWIKKKYKIPYILSEHWTGYLKEARPNYTDQSWLTKMLTKRVFKAASQVTFVSNELAQNVQKYFPVLSYRIIPNVVDTAIFNPAINAARTTTRFIHVSTMTYQKNIEQILTAFSLLKNHNPDFTFDMFVPFPIKLHDLIHKFGLEDQVIIHNEVPQIVLAENMKYADALVLYSRYETFGCVVIEANACGVPAILSDLPVFREYSDENKTAIFIPLDDPQELASILINFVDGKFQFDKSEIAESTMSKFNYLVVAKQFDEVYNNLSEVNLNRK